MKVLVLGKCPPIQGGVSVRTFTFVRNLVAQGHTVTYATNALCAGATYRCAWDQADSDYLTASLPAVQFENLFPSAQRTHIPFSPSFETRLLGRCTQAAVEADLIIGWYFQPYGVTAALLSKIHGRPCVLLHAGSDLGRLALDEDYAKAYRSIFSGATVLTPRSETLDRLQRLLGDTSSVHRLSRGNTLPSYFRPSAKPMTIESLSALTSSLLQQWSLPKQLAIDLNSNNSNEFPCAGPTLGFYGKVGKQKGHFDLLNALEVLAAEGVQFRVIACIGGHPAPLAAICERVLASTLLSARVRLFPFIAPWRIPGFIKTCDAVAFLERDFEISFHGPQVPMEVIQQGRALLTSQEIAKKQRFSEQLIDKFNYVNCGDPSQTEQLVDTLRFALTDTRRLREIGVRGKSLAIALDQETPKIDPVIRTLQEIGLLR